MPECEFRSPSGEMTTGGCLCELGGPRPQSRHAGVAALSQKGPG